MVIIKVEHNTVEVENRTKKDICNRLQSECNWLQPI